MTEHDLAEIESVVKYTAGRYTGNGIHIEDLIQEGSIGALEAESHYDSSKGASFATYASFWIEKRIREYAKQNWGAAAGELASYETEAAAASAQEQETVDFSEIPGLTEKEIIVLGLYLNSMMTLNQISAKLGISRSRVKEIKNRALRKIKNNRVKLGGVSPV